MFVNSCAQFSQHSATCCQTYHQQTAIAITKFRSVTLKTQRQISVVLPFCQWGYYNNGNPTDKNGNTTDSNTTDSNTTDRMQIKKIITSLWWEFTEGLGLQSRWYWNITTWNYYSNCLVRLLLEIPRYTTDWNKQYASPMKCLVTKISAACWRPRPFMCEEVADGRDVNCDEIQLRMVGVIVVLS